MGKAKKGGVYGFLRGRVGSVSYSILNASRSKSGTKEQVVRALPDQVANPQTAGQVMQRMKLAPAQKFYNAFSELLSNAFEGVQYGEASRRYFMSLAMAQDGPYVQKGVDRFIPAQYPFSRGSIPAVGIEEFDGGSANTVITLAVTTEEANVTNELLATLLGVTTDYQITIAVVNNINGVFVPSYIGFDDRLKITDIPAGALAKDAENHITISPAAFGLDASNMVAQVVVLSVQDASGNWLRSEQNMVISNQLIEALYGTTALEAAIYSYQTSNGAQNAINSQWYYNLGLAQAFAGKLTTTYIAADVDESHGYGTRTGIVGVKQLNGVIKYTIFTESADADSAVMIVKNGEIVPWVGDGDTITAAMIVEPANVDVEVWQPAYAQQLGYMQGDNSTEQQKLYWREFGENSHKLLVDNDGKVVVNKDVATDSCIIAMVNGVITVCEEYSTDGGEIGTTAELEAAITAWGSIKLDYSYVGGPSIITVPYAGKNYLFPKGVFESIPDLTNYPNE